MYVVTYVQYYNLAQKIESFVSFTLSFLLSLYMKIVIVKPKQLNIASFIVLICLINETISILTERYIRAI